MFIIYVHWIRSLKIQSSVEKKQVQKPKMEADDLPQTLKLVCLLPRSNLTTFLETRPKRRLHTARATCDLVAQLAAYVGWSALSRDHF